MIHISDKDRIAGKDLVARLCFDEEKCWATYNKGDHITQRQIAKLLRQYKIKSKDMKILKETVKCYAISDFHEAFERYLPSTPITELEEEQLLN